MSLQTIGAFFPGNALKHVADQADLIGASRGKVVQYLAYRAAGLSHNEALNYGRPHRNLSEFPNDIRRIQSAVDKEIIDKIRARYPGKDLSWALRYHAAMLREGADETYAAEVADGIRRGPRPKVTVDA